MAETTSEVTVNATTVEPANAELPGSFQEELRGSSEDRPALIQLGSNIKKYSIPPVSLTGLVCNVLILCVMRRPSLKATTTAVYFTSLAVVDNLHLLHSVFSSWSTTTFDANLYDFYDITCRLKHVLSMFTSNSPAWLVIAMTAERVVVITFPLRAKQWCTRRAATVVSVSIILFFATLWVVLLFMWGVSSGPCDKKSDGRVFMVEHGYLLGIVLYSLIPSPLLIVLNAVLIYQLVKSRTLRRKMLTATPSAKGVVAGGQSQEASLSRITVMAVVVSLTYLILTVPALTFAYINIIVNKRELKDTMAEPLWKFLQDVSVVLREMNHAVNLFLYLLILPKVRSELVALSLPCRRQGRERESTKNSPTASTGNKNFSDY